MAASAGRRNALREISSVMIPGTLYNLPNASFPPTPTSPEEQVIKQLGKKRAAYDDYYDEEMLMLVRTPVKTPKKQPLSPRKYQSPKRGTPSKNVSLPTRSSPRKRLNMNLTLDDFDETSALAGMSLSGSMPKKNKLDKFVPAPEFERSLLALNQTQLVGLITAAANASPVARQIMETMMPEPDMKGLDSRLSYLQKNVGKAIPRNGYSSQKDSYCFSRIKLHIESFVKECQEHSRRLVESQNWAAVLEFTQMAWVYAKRLPDFEDVANNKLKAQCLRQLATNLVTIVKKIKQEKWAIEGIIERIKEFQPDRLIDDCVTIAERLLLQAK